MLVALIVALGVYAEHGADCVITACTDGKHGKRSLHAFGYALDLRTRRLTDVEVAEIAGQIAARLSKEYDILIEDDHIHVEFDPR
jgi:hypothetical protein